jgi:hypothetical protein
LRSFRAGAISTIGVALTLLGASASKAADNPVLRSVLTLCRANHSRATEVLAAADRDGWKSMPGGANSWVEHRWKVIEGKGQMLGVMRMPMALADGTKAMAHQCQVNGYLSADLLPSLRALMGHPPTDNGPGSIIADWFFTERNGKREFLPNDAATAAAVKTGPVECVMVSKAGYVAYIEIVAAKP